MFSLGYAFNELRRRFGRTLVTALGLAPIAVVQPIGVFALVVTALITARTRFGSTLCRAAACSIAASIITSARSHARCMLLTA